MLFPAVQAEAVPTVVLEETVRVHQTDFTHFGNILDDWLLLGVVDFLQYFILDC